MDQHHETLLQLAKEDGLTKIIEQVLEETTELKHVLSSPAEHKIIFGRQLTNEIADVLVTVHKLIALLKLETVVDAMVVYKIQRTIHEKENEYE